MHPPRHLFIHTSVDASNYTAFPTFIPLTLNRIYIQRSISLYISIYLYIHLSIYPSLFIVHLSTYPSIYISVYIYISIYLYIRLSSYSSIWLLSIRPSVCMCVGMHCISFGHQPKQLGKKHKINVTQTENGRECSGQKCSFHPYIDETCDKIPQIQIITLDNEALG